MFPPRQALVNGASAADAAADPGRPVLQFEPRDEAIAKAQAADGTQCEL